MVPGGRARSQPFLHKLEAVQLPACYEHKPLIQVPLLFKKIIKFLLRWTYLKKLATVPSCSPTSPKYPWAF